MIPATTDMGILILNIIVAITATTVPKRRPRIIFVIFPKSGIPNDRAKTVGIDIKSINGRSGNVNNDAITQANRATAQVRKPVPK